jgi:hypothetical protein
MKEIIMVRSLGKEKIVKVDDGDYRELINYNWCLLISSMGAGKEYACRATTREERDNGYPKQILMHRQILEVLLNSRVLVDHRNRDGLDNRRENLRLATRYQNAINSDKVNPNCSSDYKGVSYIVHAGKWQAAISCNGKKYYLGIFSNEADAAIAYNRKAVELFGEYAKINRIES